MRSPERIDEILSLLGKTWRKNGDLRFLQLIYILQSKLSKENNDVGKIETENEDGLIKIGYDLFDMEDDKLIEFLRNWL